MKSFAIYFMLMGYPLPAQDGAQFTNMSACQIYLHTHYDEQVQEAFKIYCEETTPTICQGKPCE